MQAAEEAAGEEEEVVEEEAGSDEWEYETDSEEDDSKQLVKPVFVPKTSRATIEERDKIDQVCQLLRHHTTL